MPGPPLVAEKRQEVVQTGAMKVDEPRDGSPQVDFIQWSWGVRLCDPSIGL